jgi:hypothetical protein
MAMSGTARRWLLWSGIVILILALRVACVIHERSRPFRQKPVAQKRLEPDHLVVLPKFYVEDFQSARQLAGKPLWVKLGYSTEYFALAESGQAKRSAPRHTFVPLERLTVEEVVERPIHGQNKDKEVWLIFRKEGKTYATVAGFYNSEQERYQMQLDELFYLRDPRELYSHWGEDVWRKIERHQLEPQMTLNQTFLSLGFGSLVMTEAGGVHLYQFGRKPGGEPGKTRVRFLEGRVKEFEVMH